MSYPGVLWFPVMRLATTRALKRNFDIGQGFKQDRIRIQSREDGLTGDRALDQDICHFESIVLEHDLC